MGWCAVALRAGMVGTEDWVMVETEDWVKEDWVKEDWVKED